MRPYAPQPHGLELIDQSEPTNHAAHQVAFLSLDRLGQPRRRFVTVCFIRILPLSESMNEKVKDTLALGEVKFPEWAAWRIRHNCVTSDYLRYFVFRVSHDDETRAKPCTLQPVML
jgi:hypothetical protein